MKSTLDKLYEQREENEKEREIIEREKLDLVNLNEQIIGILINIENIKKNGKAEWADLVRQQISLLNLDPKQFGF